MKHSTSDNIPHCAVSKSLVKEERSPVMGWVWQFFRAAPNCGHNRPGSLGWLCVSIGYSATGKAGGYVRHA
ncbi:MAG: hypothetical protein ACYCUV_10180, partial [Phycisphaerae bacterium]